MAFGFLFFANFKVSSKPSYCGFKKKRPFQFSGQEYRDKNLSFKGKVCVCVFILVRWLSLKKSDV